MDTKNNLKTPLALANWKIAVNKSGLAFVAPDELGKVDVFTIYKDVEAWLDETAAKWGEVRLLYNGAKQGLRKIAVMSESANGEEGEGGSEPSSPIDDSRQIITPMAESELISEILGYDGGSCCLLRMSDDSPLFSNAATESTSGIRPNDWIKIKDHGPWWLGTELSDYKARLLRDGSVRNYSYAARFIGAGGQVHQFTVNTRLVNYRGDVCRLVKNVACVPIEL